METLYSNLKADGLEWINDNWIFNNEVLENTLKDINQTKLLEREDYIYFKLFKKAMQEINKIADAGKFLPSVEMPYWGLLSDAKKYIEKSFFLKYYLERMLIEDGITNIKRSKEKLAKIK